MGKNVSKFKVGDYAGVGCMVNSCGECDACKRSQEQFCENGKTIFTYNSCDVFHGNENTYGGYSNNIVVSEKFAVCVPKDAPMEKSRLCFVQELPLILRLNFQISKKAQA